MYPDINEIEINNELNKTLKIEYQNKIDDLQNKFNLEKENNKNNTSEILEIENGEFYGRKDTFLIGG